MYKVIVFDLVLIGKGVHLFLQGNFNNKYVPYFPYLGFNVYGESISQIQNINSEEEINFIHVYVILSWCKYTLNEYTFVTMFYMENLSLYVIFSQFHWLMSFFLYCITQHYFNSSRQLAYKNHHFHSKQGFICLCYLSIIICQLLYISLLFVTIKSDLRKITKYFPQRKSTFYLHYILSINMLFVAYKKTIQTAKIGDKEIFLHCYFMWILSMSDEPNLKPTGFS